MPIFPRRTAVPALILLAACALRADVTPNSLFSDDAVLPRDVPLPVWGDAANGEAVTVELDGKTARATVQDGHWKAVLPPHAAGGPFTLTIRGKNTVTAHNVLLGDVWVASGQSNMERQLGLRPPQPPIDDWQKEVAAADYPKIREYYVPEVPAVTPVADVHGRWAVCSPRTVGNFTAVGYFFARDLHKATGVPIGILFTAWGGTTAQAWTSPAALKELPDFAAAGRKAEELAAGGNKALVTPAQFFLAHDPGSAADHSWAAADFDAGAWPVAAGDTYHEEAATAFAGIVWTRREVDLPPGWAGRAAVLHLGQVDDDDTTFLNGVQIGATNDWRRARNYKIPAGALKAGRNVIAVRIVNAGRAGGILAVAGNLFSLELAALPGAAAPANDFVPLAGQWRYRTSTPMDQLTDYPPSATPGPAVPAALFNGMVAPLLPLPIKGVVWYQGEANNDRPQQYRTLFPAMIADWRRQWGIGDFPFLFVQIAPHKEMTPEIREAQLLTLQKSPATAMVVTTDLGEALNIHPPHKAPVGARLALAARALAYHQAVEYSGPLYRGMQTGPGGITIRFEHVGGGLTARGGALRGFTIAGEDGKFVPAQAAIQGDTVVVSSEQVPHPAAVRYGWANVPDVNLFNQAGLPASPFRTDDPAGAKP